MVKARRWPYNGVDSGKFKRVAGLDSFFLIILKRISMAKNLRCIGKWGNCFIKLREKVCQGHSVINWKLSKPQPLRAPLQVSITYCMAVVMIMPLLLIDRLCPFAADDSLREVLRGE